MVEQEIGREREEEDTGERYVAGEGKFEKV